MTYRKPISSEYPVYYFPFIKVVEQENALEAMRMVHADTQSVLENLTDEQGLFRYEEGKWSIKELLGHIIDCERIHQYRALCIARGETTPLPGFDQDLYVAQSNAESRRLESLLHEFEATRKSSITLFASFTEEMLSNVGNANGYDLTARAISFILPGHEKHHINIVKERYLPHFE